jgi:hypothetical protein
MDIYNIYGNNWHLKVNIGPFWKESRIWIRQSAWKGPDPAHKFLDSDSYSLDFPLK